MGKWVHVVSRIEEYGDIEFFNWGQEEFKALLTSLECYVIENEEFSDRWEVEKYEYKRAIKFLKEYKEKGCIKELEDDSDFKAAFKSLGFSTSNLIFAMESLLNQSDKNSDWLIFVAY